MTQLNKVISGIFHPLLMPTYVTFLAFKLVPSLLSPINDAYIYHFIGIIFITTFVIPGASIVFLKLTKVVGSLELLERKERFLPFLFVASFYGITTYMLHFKLSISQSMTALMLLTTFLIIVLSLISLRNKVSIHAASVWGVCGIVCAIGVNYSTESFLLIIGTVFIIAGITSSSRLFLGRHTPSQVWQGAAIGFVICFIGTFLFV